LQFCCTQSSEVQLLTDGNKICAVTDPNHPFNRWNLQPPPTAVASLSRMATPLVRKLCALDVGGERALEMAVRRMGFSARAHDRILKVARTIADLDESSNVSAKHVAEAVQYRSLDRNYWS
jgi:Magnesium chelatase, subunit ChlI C-terminal